MSRPQDPPPGVVIIGEVDDKFWRTIRKRRNSGVLGQVELVEGDPRTLVRGVELRTYPDRYASLTPWHTDGLLSPYGVIVAQPGPQTEFLVGPYQRGTHGWEGQAWAPEPHQIVRYHGATAYHRAPRRPLDGPRQLWIRAGQTEETAQLTVSQDTETGETP